MKHKKQQYIPVLRPDTIDEFVAPNRKTVRGLAKLGKKFVRPDHAPHANAGEKKEFSEFRRQLAKKHGSKTGQLKKKHINRERIWQEARERAELHMKLGDE
jgi:hypothetical protein